MSGGLRRRLADAACRMLQAALPDTLRDWGRAIRHETAAIPDDTRALAFALGSLCGLLPQALAARARGAAASALSLVTPPAGSPHPMTLIITLLTTLAGRPRAVGLGCATGAVALGLVYLTLAGAPPRYLALNLGAWTVGVMLLCALGSLPPRGWHRHGALLVAMAAILLATGLLGSSVAGAARWLRLGGLALQPSLVLLPVMLVASARGADRLAAAGPTTAALGLTALALAIQPDRAMAGVLVAALGVLALRRPQPPRIAAFAAGVIGFAVTLLRADALPAVPHVDQVLSGAFAVHPLAGLAVVVGAGLLVVPALVGWAGDPANRTGYAVFGVVWAGVVAAAALGNYPTPLVGYGGSAILGYALSLLALPRRARAVEQAGASRPGRAAGTRGGQGRSLMHRPA